MDQVFKVPDTKNSEGPFLHILSQYLGKDCGVYEGEVHGQVHGCVLFQ
jgi:hypothetical protein